MFDGKVDGNPTVAIAATFTAEPVLASLGLLLGTAGLPLNLKLAPYGQVFQELLSGTSLLATNSGGANVLLVRMEDFVRDIDSTETARAVLERTARELSDGVSQFAQRTQSPIILAALAPSPQALEPLRPALQDATALLNEQAASLPAVQLVSSADIDGFSCGERYDTLRDELAHIPYTEEYYAAMALAIARKIHALRLPAHKVLVLDCDNTLWRGVVGEDGVEGIIIPEPLLQVQRFAMRTQATGTLICLTSKNSERDVLEVFDKRPEMILKKDAVVAHRINWQPKPQNIASLARELNLGLDSFVFLDDNPIECAQMRAELPQVVTLQLPPEPEIEQFLANLWTFDKLAVTNEDTRRTSLYRENLARQLSESSATDIGDFIASLGLTIDMAPPAESEWSRVAQLTQRTNQFNFTTVRRTEAELRAAAQAGSVVLGVRVRDRFGDYGLVGLLVAKAAPSKLLVDTMLLSCRVLGRGVEHAMLRRLGELATQMQLSDVELPYVQSEKNEPAQAFADSVAADCKLAEQRRVLYRIGAARAASIEHRPGHDPQAVLAARRSEETKATSVGIAPLSAASQNRSERYTNLASTFGSARAIIEALHTKGLRRRPLPGKAIQPASQMERQLLKLWQKVLNIDELGVEDNYFAVGGTSLLAARLFAEIARQFGVRLRLTTILDAPTVRMLARHIDPRGIKRKESLIELKRGGPTNFFLVHDGDGETLLYRNLARHMPDSLGIYALEPRHLPGVPLADSRIEDMARFYIAEMRKQQPHGPYLLGGLCAGGVIAYEMASQLIHDGESVKLVAMFDAARPHARKLSISRQRVKRFEQMLSSVRQVQGTFFGRASRFLKGGSSKLRNLIGWVVWSRAKQLTVNARFLLLRRLLDRQRPWPAVLPQLSLREILDCAEQHYSPPKLACTVLLVRARAGVGDDTPYQQIYADESFGWNAIAPDLEVVDADGGHSSMLQEPFVESLAAVLTPRVTQQRQPPLAAVSRVSV